MHCGSYYNTALTAVRIRLGAVLLFWAVGVEVSWMKLLSRRNRMLAESGQGGSQRTIQPVLMSK